MSVLVRVRKENSIILINMTNKRLLHNATENTIFQ